VSLIPGVPPTLYHYTCPDHGHPAIYGSGKLKPGTDGLVWLTDLELVDRAALGLVRVSTTCDRGAIRYAVEDTSGCVPWLAFRKGLEFKTYNALESQPGVMPRHWFVTWAPIKARYAPMKGIS
jgi:hypothetical protein